MQSTNVTPGDGVDSSSSFTNKRSCCSGKCLKAVDFFVNDILMVLFSMSDIALDIMVCRAFYMDGHMSFFYASMAIFLFAQCCYSFLFTLHWTKHYTSPQKCVIFFLVLPFGQFVPFLAWVESFGFECVDNAFKFLDLYTNNRANADQLTRSFEEAGGDMLYDYIQKKFYSHAGFLVEALAEAIPQSILQTIAVLYFGEPSLLFIVSIFVSICVISSKGYLISYSMHRPTFVFNLICIFADVLCMFATVCWLFNYDDDDGRPDVLFDDGDYVKLTWVVLFGTACALLIFGSGCFLLFNLLDRHHDIDMGTHYHRFESILILFLEIYLGPTLAWFFSLIPLTVSLMTFKFIFFPLSIQNDDQCNDFARYQAFYSALHEFVSMNKSDLTLQITNRFILYCKGSQHRLANSLSGVYCMKEKKRILQEWLETIGKDADSYVLQSQFNERTAALYNRLNSTDPHLARNTVRQYNSQTDFPLFNRPFKDRLSNDFRVFETFFGEKKIHQEGCCGSPTKYIRYVTALIFAFMAMPTLMLFLVVAICFLIYSWCYPLVELTRALVRNDCSILAISALPLCLTLAYVFSIVLMLILAPKIHSFNSMCADIVPLGDTSLPPVFFDTMVVKQIEKVYHNELTWQHLDSILDARFGMDVTLIIKSFCDSGNLNVEGLYGVRNMRRLKISNRPKIGGDYMPPDLTDVV